MTKTVSQPFTGRVEQGNFKAHDQMAFIDAFRKHEGREVVVSVKRHFKKRSTGKQGENDANGYYWGVVIVFWMKAMGEKDPKFMHEILKTCYHYKPVLIAGEVQRIPYTTSEDDTVEFEEFLEKCRMGYEEMYDAIIPLPNEPLSIEMIEAYYKLGNAA